MLQEASRTCFVPLTVGGGIRQFTDAQGVEHNALEVASAYFRAGADKISIGGDAVEAVTHPYPYPCPYPYPYPYPYPCPCPYPYPYPYPYP